MRVVVPPPFARHARMVLFCLWNPPWRVLRVLRVLRVTCVSILALLWRTAPRFPWSADACASEGGAPRLPGTPCRTGRGSGYGDGSRGQDDGRRHHRIVEGWGGGRGRRGGRVRGQRVFLSPLEEPSPECRTPTSPGGVTVRSPLCRFPLGKFERRQALFLNRRRTGGVAICGRNNGFLAVQ